MKLKALGIVVLEMREGERFRGLLGTVVQRRRQAPAPRWVAKKRLLGSVVIREVVRRPGSRHAGRGGENEGDVKRQAKTAVQDKKLQIPECLAVGLFEDCSRLCNALRLAQPELLLRLRPGGERFLQPRLGRLSGSAWCLRRQVLTALSQSERPARGRQPPPRANGRSS